ncbi:MAG: malate dehydrogenase, partial [Deinococcota bacterium]|nr:malate dehydrogenase [Deinococcota bacterium]
VRDAFIPTVQMRGAAVIEARGLSSAASAASAAIDHMRDWVKGTPEGDWTSMAIASDGSYGVEEGLIYSYPVTIRNGIVTVVQDLPLADTVKARMVTSEQELKEERQAVARLL